MDSLGTSEAKPPTGSGKAKPVTGYEEAKPPTGSRDDKPSIGRGKAKPPTDNREAEPTNNRREAKAHTGSGETNPPTVNGKAKPSSSSREVKTHTGSGETNPPTVNGKAKPSSSSREVKTHTGSGETNPPTVNGKAKPSSSSREVKSLTNSREAKTFTGGMEVETPTSNNEAKTNTGSREAKPPTSRREAKRSLGSWEAKSPTGSWEDNPAIGIDLGTWKCCVGVVRKGKVEIIENERASKTTPSYVAFTETERLVGEEAKAQAALNPENTIFGVKRIVGQKFVSRTFPFKVDSEKDGRPRIEIKYRGKEKVLFPEQVSAMLLTKMRRIAESHLGCQVRDAVISVPAYFNNAQRQATKNAGAIAGLNVLGLINEPSAAALAYRDNKGPTDETICVVDMGGGTLDVSVIRMEGDSGITVLETSGDTMLGGMDLDQELVEHFKEEFHKRHKVDISGNRKAIQRLRLACEKLKETLSLLRSENIEIDSLANGKNFASSITREKFNSLFFESFESVLNSVIDRTQMNKVDRIVLIGGSTRVPIIVQKLDGLHKKLDRSVNPDEAVAHGAAIHAANLKAGRNSIRDIYGHMIGYRTGDGKRELLELHVSYLPHKKAVLVKGNGSNGLQFQVFEECFNHKTGEYQECSVGELEFGKVDNLYCLEVVCKLSKNGIYSSEVKFPVLQSHSVESMIDQEKDFMKEEKDERQRQVVIHKVEAYIYDKKTVINKLNMTVGDREKFITVCEDTLAILEANPRVSEEECTNRYRKLEDLFNSLTQQARSATSTVRDETVVSASVTQQARSVASTVRDETVVSDSVTQQARSVASTVRDETVVSTSVTQQARSVASTVRDETVVSASVTQQARSVASTVRDETVVSASVNTDDAKISTILISGEKTNLRKDSQRKDESNDSKSRKFVRRHSNPEEQVSDITDRIHSDKNPEEHVNKINMEIDAVKPTKPRRKEYKKKEKVSSRNNKKLFTWKRSKSVSNLSVDKQISKSVSNLSVDKQKMNADSSENRNHSNKFINELNDKLKAKVDSTPSSGVAVAGQEAPSTPSSAGRSGNRSLTSAAVAGQEAHSGRHATYSTGRAVSPGLPPVTIAAAKPLGLTLDAKNETNSLTESAPASHSQENDAHTDFKGKISTLKRRIFGRSKKAKVKNLENSPKNV